ncbi:MAG: hypothetical protein H7336_04525 [Bacteriovorax sp.]|nr:hypothetical protein [Bacteriovorax sp.]
MGEFNQQMVGQEANTKEDNRNEEFGINESLHNEDYRPQEVVLPHFEA